MTANVRDETPLTWGVMRRALERAYREADSDGAGPHDAIAMDTIAMGFAQLESAIERELEIDETKVQA